MTSAYVVRYARLTYAHMAPPRILSVNMRCRAGNTGTRYSIMLESMIRSIVPWPEPKFQQQSVAQAEGQWVHAPGDS